MDVEDVNFTGSTAKRSSWAMYKQMENHRVRPAEPGQQQQQQQQKVGEGASFSQHGYAWIQ